MENKPTASFPMNGGDGEYSYNNNSSLQRTGMEMTTILIEEAIAKNLQMNQLMSSSKNFTIADLGCSIGPNTFIAVQNIIDAVKHNTQNPNDLEFQAFFNDRVSNDFNKLFESLPPNKQYFGAGVPGPFQGRLFPKKSVHFFHASYAIHWLSTAPEELIDKKSLAYNKGLIYFNSENEVYRAYKAQFSRDIESFLNARALEIVDGGLMAILLPDCSAFVLMDLLESSLLDMVKMGMINEEKLDSFNLPYYFPRVKELESLISKNGCFNIDKMENLERSREFLTTFDANQLVLFYRAILEGIFKQHFGIDMDIDELFDRFRTKLVPSLLSISSSAVELFFILKRNCHSVCVQKRNNVCSISTASNK